MAGILVNEGEIETLKRMVNKSTPADLVLRLFSNNVTPAETDTCTTYTECNITGYSAITLTGSNWTVVTDADGKGKASYAEQTFSLSASGTVYGYYITNSDKTILFIAEAFSDGPYNIPSGGGEIHITPTIKLD